jgi:hypothetical protein
MIFDRSTNTIISLENKMLDPSLSFSSSSPDAKVTPQQAWYAQMILQKVGPFAPSLNSSAVLKLWPGIVGCGPYSPSGVCVEMEALLLPNKKDSNHYCLPHRLPQPLS